MSVITDIVVAVHLRVEGNVKNQWDEAAWQQPVLNRFFWRYFQQWWFQSADSPSQDVWGPPLQNLVAAFPHPQHLRNARETQPGEGSVWQVIKKMFLFWSVISWSHLCRPGLLLYPVNSWCYPANSQVYSTNITRPKFIACSDSLKVSYFAFNIFLVIRE